MIIVTLAGIVHPAFRGICPRFVSESGVQVDSDRESMTRVAPAMVAAALMAGCAPDLNWREWRTADSALVQLFPCKPVRQQRRVVVAGRELQFVLQVCDAVAVTWAQAHADVGDPASVGPVLEALVDAAHGNVHAVRQPVVPQSVPGSTPQAAAGRYRVRGKAPDGRPVDEILLLFVRGTTVVQVTALGARLPDEAVDTFFGSVRAGP